MDAIATLLVCAVYAVVIGGILYFVIKKAVKDAIKESKNDGFLK